MRRRRGNRRIAGRSRRRGRRRSKVAAAASGSDDDGDKEYIAGEDEEEDEEDEEEEDEEFDDDDEEEFEFSESSSSGGGADEEEEADFDDDEEEDGDYEEVEDSVKVLRSKRRRSAGNSRRCARKSEVAERRREEDVEDLLIEVSRSKPRRAASCSRRSVRKPRIWGDRIEEKEEVEDDFIKLSRSKRKRAAPVPKRSVRKLRVSDDEDDVEEANDLKRKKNNGIRSRKDEDEDYEEDPEEDYDDDEDFTLDEVDEDEGSLVLAKKQHQKVGGKKRRKLDNSYLMNGKRSRNIRSVEDDDDDFILDDEDSVDRKRMKKSIKKVKSKDNNKSLKSKVTRKKKSPVVDSETSEFDYLTSDDDLEVKDWITVDNQKNKIKNERKRDTAEMGGRRIKTLVESDSSSSDSDFEISEEELRDLGIGGLLNRPQPKRIFAERKGEEKGKEKVSDEAAKQVCGICLSEEQMTTVQGLLNCCAHYFCFACIMEWSKVESRCPLCKRRFGTITKSSKSYPGFGLRKTVIRIQKRDQVYQPSEEEIRRILDPYENVVCMECQQGGDDSLMLLCDICDSSAHTYCVGLGREVPEGNWYCECCRSVADGPSYLVNQDTPSDHGPSNTAFSNHGMETEENKREAYANSMPQQSASFSGQPSIREFDLNASPGPEEDYGTISQASGGVAATVSGRRAIRQHIRLRFLSSRLSQTSAGNDLSHHNAENGNSNARVGQHEESLHASVSASELCQQNDRSFFQSNANLAPCSYQESSFRCVDGAKGQVHSIVKHHLQNLSRGSQLEHSTFKKIARRSTHTILAACGIKHKKKLVAGSFRPPSSCSHLLEDVSPSLIQGCCSSCFSSFAGDVVWDLLCKLSQR